MDLNNFPDEMLLYFRRDIKLNNKITLHQPTIGEIIEFGEQRYFSVAKTLVTIPSDVKPELFDIGIDYEEISDYELFCMLVTGLSKEDTHLLLGDLDFQKFKLCVDNTNGEKVLYDETTGTVIDRRIHLFISKYICKLHGFKQKVEHAANKYTKKVLIDYDRQRKEMESKKPIESSLLPMISSLVNSPGFKHDSQSVLKIGYYELNDSLRRIQLIKNTDALLHGMYSGMIKTEDIKQKDLDWMRRL